MTALPYEDGSFDAMFVFGILHHVPEWRAGFGSRVLAPGGVLSSRLHGDYSRQQDRFLF